MGLFDDIADVATGAKKKEKTHSFRMAQVKQHDAYQSGNQQQKNQADQNLKNVNNYFKEAETGKYKQEGAQTQEDIVKAINQQVIEDQQKVVEDKDKKEVVPEKEKEQVAYYDTGKGKISYRDLRLLEKKLGQTAIIHNGKIFFKDKTGSVVPAFSMIDKLGGALDTITGFDPTKAFGDMGDTGKAALYNKISKMSGSEFEKFLNRKGNLDRLLSYYEGEDFEDVSREDFDKILKNKDAQGFADLIKGSGGEGFKSELDKIQNPNKYYEDNPPQTLSDMEDMLRSGITFTHENTQMIQDARDRVSESRQQQQYGGQAGGGGGGIGDIPTTPDTTTATVPDYVLKQQYIPGFTPDYSGGAEQMHIAGGYWDPRTQKWIGGGPWGTQSQYQFPPQTPTIGVAQGGLVGTSPLLFKNQGGMVNDGGIKSFKKYGY